MDGFRGGVKNWWSTLTMRAAAAEYQSLHLREHKLLRDVPLYDVSSGIFPEAATDGPSRTFVRSNPRPLRATSRLSFAASAISFLIHKCLC